MDEIKLGPQWEINGQLGERKTLIVNRCSCGEEYTLSQFRTLEYVGEQKVDDGGLPAAYELRNCVCRSTIAIGTDGRGIYCEEKFENDET